MAYTDPEKQRAYNKAYRAANREKRRLALRAWRAANPEKNRAHFQKRNATHKELLAEQARRRRAANPEASRASTQKYKATHPDKERATRQASRKKNAQKANLRRQAHRTVHPEGYRQREKAWRQANPEKYHAKQLARYARERGAAVCDLTAAQWREIQEAYEHCCVYCGRRAKGHLTQDHLTPLSQGGEHTASNVVPACRSCNSKKHIGPVLVPVQPLLLTVAEPKKKKAS